MKDGKGDNKFVITVAPQKLISILNVQSHTRLNSTAAFPRIIPVEPPRNARMKDNNLSKELV